MSRVYRHEGQHFLHIPGPTNVPPTVLRAMSRATIDHRGPEFAEITRRVLEGVARIAGSDNPAILYPSSGTGAWEAALVNTLSPGDAVLMFDSGVFANAWGGMAERLGLEVHRLEQDWRTALDADRLHERLRADTERRFKAVAVVHNETSTGVTNDIARIRSALDEAVHPALLLVDTISSLGSIKYNHDAWRVDVSVGCSQKGLMLPPGIGLNLVSDRALEANEHAGLPRSYWDWRPMLASNAKGAFPYTPPTNLIFALDAAIQLLEDEGLPDVFRRHERFAEATRRAVKAWNLEFFAINEAERSNSLTAVQVPSDIDAEHLRSLVLEHFDTSLGAGLGPLRQSVFRIGHLGALNEPMLLGALAAIEGGLRKLGVKAAGEGVAAALQHLVDTCE